MACGNLSMGQEAQQICIWCTCSTFLRYEITRDRAQRTLVIQHSTLAREYAAVKFDADKAKRHHVPIPSGTVLVPKEDDSPSPDRYSELLGSSC